MTAVRIAGHRTEIGTLDFLNTKRKWHPLYWDADSTNGGGGCYKILVKKIKRRDLWRDIGVNRTIILKCILK
jgi:hypothetical protein